ncbi:MAG: MATE family efflux transporter [Lachnospiraceae bacterium]|nr:MATE family efflux transporter [Lachnospiraceae bacterium]
MSIKNKYIGNKAFYTMVLTIAVPIMVQNGVSNFVSLLDNLMIGRVGTNALSGVAIGNQLIFVYYLLIFGATAGVGIFTAQYHGCGDVEGVRSTFRIKLLINFVLSAASILVFFVFAEKLINLFLQGEGAPEDAAETLKLGHEYMLIMLIGLIPIGITNAYAGTLRDTGETRAPMRASIIAIFVNLTGNALLIYGLFGLPALGAAGAAIATVISRFVELAVLVIYTAKNKDKHPFIEGAFSHFHVSMWQAKKYILKSLPLMANETLWALGQTMMNQCYSHRSLDAVAALNIQSTIWNLLGVAFLAMGEAVGIIVGQILGSGDIEKARDHARKMIVFNVGLGTVFGGLMLLVSPFFPLLYNTSNEIRSMATVLIFITGILMPVYAFTHASYFTIRAGGNTFITFIFDSCFVWVISVPTAFCLSHFTLLTVPVMLAIVQSMELLKGLIGGLMVHSGIWAKNLVGE